MSEGPTTQCMLVHVLGEAMTSEAMTCPTTHVQPKTYAFIHVTPHSAEPSKALYGEATYYCSPNGQDTLEYEVIVHFVVVI